MMGKIWAAAVTWTAQRWGQASKPFLFCKSDQLGYMKVGILSASTENTRKFSMDESLQFKYDED
jgi:hypothetical protein